MKALFVLIGLVVGLAFARAADIPAIPEGLDQPPPRPGLEITADLMMVYLRSNMVYYSNNVVVTDPPAKAGDPPTVLRCNELTGTRGTNGRLDTIIAQGAVAMKQGDLTGLGERAVYTATNEQIHLTGGYPGTGTNLPMLVNGQGATNLGQAIVYDRRAGTLWTLKPITIIPDSAFRSTTNAPGKGTNAPRRPRGGFTF